LPYVLVALILLGFLFVSNLARQNLLIIQQGSIEDVKIVPFASHLDLHDALRTFHGALLGILESSDLAINLWGVTLIGIYCWQEGRTAYSLFLWTLVTATPVAFIAGTSDTRFRYLPLIAGATFIAYFLQMHWQKVCIYLKSPLNAAVVAALAAGTIRAVYFCGASDFTEYDAPARAFRDHLASESPLIPLVLGVCLVTSYLLWRANFFTQDILVVVILVAGGSQLGVWATSLPINPVSLVTPILTMFLCPTKSWKNIVLVVTLWELPILTLPVFLSFYGPVVALRGRTLWQRPWPSKQ